jgi:hypothetical protein
MKKAADTVLLEHFGTHTQPKITVQQGPSDCPGSSITWDLLKLLDDSHNKALKCFPHRLVAHTSTGCVLGASAIGNRKKQPYDIGAQAANDLIAAKPGLLCLDPHLQDQVSV